MPPAPRSGRQRPDATPGPWRYDPAAGDVRTAGPAPRTLATLRVAGRAGRPARETEADGRLMAAAPRLADALGALCDATAALLDAIDRAAAVPGAPAAPGDPAAGLRAYAAAQAALSDGVMAVAAARVEGWPEAAEAAGWAGPGTSGAPPSDGA
jgi:hypothetical protein